MLISPTPFGDWLGDVECLEQILERCQGSTEELAAAREAAARAKAEIQRLLARHVPH